MDMHQFDFIDTFTDHEPSGCCWCRPEGEQVNEDGDILWVHRSHDGAELIEKHNICQN